jgi:hypothetical protein
MSQVDQNEPPSSGLSRVAGASAKVFALYLLFGVAFWFMALTYINFRASVGSPSDLPFDHPMWGSMLLFGCLVAWPVIALGLVINGSAVAVSDLAVRAVGVAWLVALPAVLIWLNRRGNKR